MPPDFLCIGAKRVGKAWLYYNISYHPDVWMPPIKEIHYFDDPSTKPIITRLISRKSDDRRWKRLATRLLFNPKMLFMENRFKWYMRFFLLPRYNDWYESLFLRGESQITGDITPSYAILDESSILKIYNLMPKARIIYLLRNPIHRIWSQAAMHFSKDGYHGLWTISEKKIMKFLYGEDRYRQSDYLSNLEVWEKFYNKDQILIGFFDKLVSDPRVFFKDILRFLNLDDSEKYIPQSVNIKRNSYDYPVIPDHISSYLSKLCHSSIEKLHQRFDNEYTASWLEYAKKRREN